MRRIKFRVWDKKNKKFLKPYREQHIGNWVNTLSINMDGSLSFHEDDGFGGKSVGGESIEKRFELMQYTGLKDLNGTEIYEGDIIWDDHAEIHGKVTFDEGMFCVEWETHIEHLFGVVIDGYAEVMGDIYENPELLGDNQ